ncbi:MAG: hypothetical protein NVS2B4_00400 [Ramlibacter sp.]
MSCLVDLVPSAASWRAFRPCEFRVQWAAAGWEQQRGFALRRAVFCGEQGLFEGDDRDAVDEQAQMIVALACVAGVPDDVVGTVRIHESTPGTWWGSRLAVHAAFRHHGRIGATLIQLAVASAHASGCHTFLAHVQSQNVPLFERLHWHALGSVVLHGRPHERMQADLGHYPPCHAPAAGYVTRSGGLPP